MRTFFALPERAKQKDLTTEIEILSTNPVMTGLLESVCGLLAVVNEHRQIVAINDAFLHLIGVDDPGKVDFKTSKEEGTVFRFTHII